MGIGDFPHVVKSDGSIPVFAQHITPRDIALYRIRRGWGSPNITNIHNPRLTESMEQIGLLQLIYEQLGKQSEQQRRANKLEQHSQKLRSWLSTVRRLSKQLRNEMTKCELRLNVKFPQRFHRLYDESYMLRKASWEWQQKINMILKIVKAATCPDDLIHLPGIGPKVLEKMIAVDTTAE